MKIKNWLIGIVIVLCVLAVLVYTAFPHNAYACLRSHVVIEPRYTTICEKVGKGEECMTRLVGFFPVTICDVYSSPTPVAGWFWHR